MKKSLLWTISLCALFAANGALAGEGYVCEDERKYVSCKDGTWYLDVEGTVDVNGTATNIGTCKQCPEGFDAAAAYVEGQGNCKMIINKGDAYYASPESDRGVYTACPGGGVYCPGDDEFLYKDFVAKSGEYYGAVSCKASEFDAMIEGAIADTQKCSHNNLFKDDLFVTFVNSSGVRFGSDEGAEDKTACYFVLPKNHRIVASKPSNYESFYIYQLTLAECPSGRIQIEGAKVTAQDIADNWTCNVKSAYRGLCGGCPEQEYAPNADSGCVACDIYGNLGIDESFGTAVYTGDSNDAYTYELCAYNFPEVQIDNGVLKNMQCHLSSANGTYQCFVDPASTERKGTVACSEGYVVPFTTTGKQNKCMPDGTTTAISPMQDNLGKQYLQINDPKTMSCELVPAGCYQNEDESGFEAMDSASEMLNAIVGVPCSGGNFYCLGGTNVEACPIPDPETFRRDDNQAIKMSTTEYASSPAACYVPATGTSVLYVDGLGNKFYLMDNCEY